MIKVEIDQRDGKTVASCDLMGSEGDIVYEVLQALGIIYAAVKGEFSPAFLYAFRQYLVAAVLDPTSPIWTTNPKGENKVVFRMPEGQP